jgi:cytochrome d ubiquinol oxidase subunit II
MITYEFLQQYWWFIISLLAGLLVFLMFVQGANSLIFAIGRTEEEKKLIVNSTGRKWEFTFTTLVTFGGAFFASFPLFYSTSFGGAYWVWMLILVSFVLQAVSYEFQNKPGNIFGSKIYRRFLVFNGVFGPFLIGVAVATFFNGSNFIVNKASMGLLDNNTISHWANASHGLDALLDPWNLIFGFAVLFLSRMEGALYMINNINDKELQSRLRLQLLRDTVPFLILFLAFLEHVLVKDGYGVDAAGVISMVPYKYALNLWQMPMVSCCIPRWCVIGFIWYDSQYHIKEVYPWHLVRGIWHNIDRDSVVLSRRLQQYGLLSIECRLAKFALSW